MYTPKVRKLAEKSVFLYDKVLFRVNLIFEYINRINFSIMKQLYILRLDEWKQY